jgi:hypothetical protein
MFTLSDAAESRQVEFFVTRMPPSEVRVYELEEEAVVGGEWRHHIRDFRIDVLSSHSTIVSCTSASRAGEGRKETQLGRYC